MTAEEIKIECSCGQHIAIRGDPSGQAFSCPACGGSIFIPKLELPPPVIPQARPPIQPPPLIRQNAGNPQCIHCSQSMHRTSRREHDYVMQILGIVLFLVGLALCFTVVGLIIGIPLMIVAARIGYKTRKVWACQSCGYFYEY
jgi:hypothetical protein